MAESYSKKISCSFLCNQFLMIAQYNLKRFTYTYPFKQFLLDLINTNVII